MPGSSGRAGGRGSRERGGYRYRRGGRPGAAKGGPPASAPRPIILPRRRTRVIRGRFATQLAAAACALSLAAALFLALWPESYQGTSVTTDGRVTGTSASLIEENGAGVLLWLLLPVAACLWGLLP